MIVGFFGVIAMALLLMFQPYVEPQNSENGYDLNIIDDMATHFIVYKNIISSHVFQHPGEANGLLSDQAVAASAPSGWQFPAFDHKAQKDSNGWAYVWSDVSGSFYNKVYENSDYSVSVCKVISTRQCVRSNSTTATLPSSLVPSYITIGSTVYAWRY